MTTRRSLLKSFAAGLGVTACAGGTERLPYPGRDARRPDALWSGLASADPAVFPLGVQSGDPLPDSIVLWTRTDAPSLEAIVMRWTDAGWEEERVLDIETADGFARIEVGDLPEDTHIAFQFRTPEGAHSSIGHGRTAPADDARGVVTFGAVSCCGSTRRPYPSLSAAAAIGGLDLDLFLWLGDTIYGDSAYTRSQYLSVWRINQQTEGFQDLYGVTSQVYTLDDHEINNDYEGPSSGETQARVANALGAYLDSTPTRTSLGDALWRSLKYGDIAEFFVLDCRTEREPDAAQYLSPEQMSWLKEGLASSTATWKVILNSVPITKLNPVYDLVQDDRWEGYSDEREALLDHITDEGITGVLFISGDFHHPGLYRVWPDGPRSQIFEVLVGPGGSGLNPLPDLVATNDQYLWHATIWNTGWFQLHSDGIAVIRILDEDGAIAMEAVLRDDGELISV